MRQVLPIAGAIVGAYFGNPQLGFAIGSLIGNVVDPQEIQGSKVGDNPMQTASEGGARAIVFGTGCVRATCLLERGNRQIVEVEDQAGKGGPVTVNERVYWTFAIGLGEAIPGGAIIRIWEGEKLVYDASPESTIPAETAEFARKFRFYDGSEDQLPDPALEAINGVGNTHYYRGTAYVVFPNYDLTDYREQIPVYRWEIASVAEVVRATELVAIRAESGGSGFMFSDSNGSSWTPWATLSANPVYWLHSSRNKMLAWGSGAGAGPFYMERGSTTWYSSGGHVSGTKRDGYVAPDNRAWIPNGLAGGLSRSVDGLTTFEQIPGAPGGEIITIAGVFHMIWFSQVWTSPNGSDDWERHPDDLPFNFGNGVWGDSDGTTAILVGGGSGGTPLAVEFRAGGYRGYPSIPFSDAAIIQGVCSGRYGMDSRWLACADSGELAYRTPDGNWHASATRLEFNAKDATFNGGYFFVIGDDGTNGYIARSQDADEFEVVYTEALGFLQQWTGIEAFYATTGTAVGEPVPLSSILTALHLRSGHTSSDFDVSECPELVKGVVFESSVTFAEAINSVIGSYFKDPSEYDRKIRYISRGKGVVRTLTEDDLVDEPETSRRENAIEYPRKLHYFFQSPITHYAATKATSARSSPDVHVIGEVSISSPITYDNPDEPAQASAKLHKVYWADAEGEIVWHITDEHADLVPGDCVGLNLRGVVRRARITSIEDDPGVRKLTMRIDRQSAYTSNVTGIPLPPPTPPRPSIIAPSVGLTMDIPALTDDADDLHYLRAIFGITDVWAGAIDQRSMDGGASFSSINTASRAAIVGTLQAGVTAGSPHFTDSTNQVVVNLYVDRTLESISQQQFLREGGAFALSYMDGGVRKWELCQYRDAEQDSDGNWILTTLHRGLLNTSAAAHASGDYFVLLGRGLLKNSAQTAWIGQEMVHRAVSNGLTPETAATETTTYTGQSQTEWPVASVGLELDGDDLAVSIVPRHRFGTDAHPVRSLNWTGYRITATDGANSATYETTADEAVIDVSGWSGTIDVSVAQINRITGPGPTVTESIAA